MEIVLNRGELVCIDGDARKLVISCQVGRLWVTQPGDPNDYTVRPGENFAITCKGRIAVTAFENSQVSFTAPIGLKQPFRPWQVLAV